MSEGKSQQPVLIKGYRRVFKSEMRLYRLDKWRIPYPHGVPYRGILYFGTLVALVAIMLRLPLIGLALGSLPPSVLWLGVPGGGSVALMRLQIDGRPPHHALFHMARHAVRPKTLSGLRPVPSVGQENPPLGAVAVARTETEAELVPGRVVGPSRVVLRYPSVAYPQKVPKVVWERDAEGKSGLGRLLTLPKLNRDMEVRQMAAKQLVIQRQPGRGPQRKAAVLNIPEGKEAVFE